MRTELEVVCGSDVLHVEGLFIYRDYKAGEESLRAFWTDYQKKKPVFDDCIGSYRVCVELHDGGKLYFGDTSGAMFWYLDDETGAVLRQISEVPVEERKPDYASIAQFFWFGCIYGMGTILRGITRSDPEFCYLLRDGRISAQSKNLTPLEKLPGGEDALEQYIRRVLKATDGKETIGCSITSGTDSRSVLAHLYANGIRPQLSITGTDEHADVRAAKQIADILGQDLMVISGKPENATWLRDSLHEVNGSAGACGAYRLIRQFQELETRGITLQFGGVAGEFYKNSFINQDYPRYGGKPDWERFLKFKVITYDFPKTICGPALLPEVEKIPDTLLCMARKHQGSTKASAYLSAGYRILQARGGTLSMTENRHVVTCSPLVERCVAAPMFRADPYKLEMQAYQRKQVTTFCPQIKDVPTDRNLTCDSSKQTAEWMKSMAYLIRVAMRRIFHRKQVSARIDVCFEQGLHSHEFYQAVEQCKSMGVLSSEVKPDSLPLGIADRVLTVGNVFRS